MRVLHFITSLDRGGIENWLVSVLRVLDREQCSIDFLCKGETVGEMAVEARELGAAVHHVPMGLNPLGFVIRSRDVLKSGRYDIAHGHLEAFSALPVLAAKGLGIPVISSFHNIEFQPQTRIARNLLIRPVRSVFTRVSISYSLNRSDFITGCSKSVLENLGSEETGWTAKARVIYYGVDIEPKTPRHEEEARRIMGVPSGVPVVAHIGRFIEQKNHQGLLRIYREIRNHVPQTLLVLIGNGPLRQRVMEMASELGIRNGILHLGIRRDARFLLYGCDVLLFPSFYEGFGLVALEANAAGLPVVGSKTSGIEEAVDDGVTGLLFDPDDIEGMARACVRFLTDGYEKTLYGMKGVERAKERFSVERSALNLLSAYGEIVRIRESGQRRLEAQGGP